VDRYSILPLYWFSKLVSQRLVLRKINIDLAGASATLLPVDHIFGAVAGEQPRQGT
jgi:hypothetical protein